MLPVVPRMTEQPPLRFRHRWRPYQEEILRDFALHCGDGHFHIVAAPGSGKTVLGLEAVRLLESPAMIFAPTIVVREQWIERLRRDFLDAPPEAPDPEWLSRDPGAPGWLTFSTYQALSVFYKRNEEKTLHEGLEQAGVRVLVADEAHHLRAFWWKCLRDLKKRLGSPTIIALTATPPYDVPQSEWNHYATFCGEVDAEVTAPELVAAGSLCAHQDLVHLSVPRPGEATDLAEHHLRIGRLFRDICLDAKLAARLFSLPVFATVGQATLSDSLEFYLSAALYFSENHGRIPVALWDTLELHNLALPPFDLRWLATFLSGLYFGPGEAETNGGILDAWKQRLHEAGVIHKRQIHFDPPEEREKALARSVGKLEAISDIVTHEATALRDGLRAVVLCDHIRERDFPSGLGPVAEKPFVRLGVVPAFESVRRLRLPDVRPAILTGTLMAIPADSRATFLAGCAAVGVETERLTFTPFAHDPGFLRLSFLDADRHAAVGVMTRLFEGGTVNVLFGTAALLGEGWDAPAVNTLVIASTIGSYVMSNQMRGRAIRALRDDPSKTANIWHLATVSDHDRDGPASDFGKLRRRFEAFAGLSSPRVDEPPALEVGLARLGMEDAPLETDVPALNGAMFARAEDRETMRRQWPIAVVGESKRRVRAVRELAVVSRKMESKFSSRFSESRLWGGLYRWLVGRRMERIARVVFESLRGAGHLAPDCPPSALVCRFEDGRCHAGLTGRPAREQTVFSRSMLELFDPFVARLRYFIVTDEVIYGVPALLGANAELARTFSRLWKRHVCAHDLHYFDTPPGRRALLLHREHALLTRQDLAPKISTRWG
jgi:hypothetical protein